jgi:hypothetical protein
LAVIAIGGCHLPARTAGSSSLATGRVTVITEEQIAGMSVRTAWDIVRMRAPRFTTGQDATGRPMRVRIQSERSANVDETPLLVVDGAQVSDIGYLSQIPAAEVRTIRILDSEAAEPLYGLAAAGGAIVVETKRGR